MVWILLHITHLYQLFYVMFLQYWFLVQLHESMRHGWCALAYDISSRTNSCLDQCVCVCARVYACVCACVRARECASE